jgi:hypothetical protein
MSSSVNIVTTFNDVSVIAPERSNEIRVAIEKNASLDCVDAIHILVDNIQESTIEWMSKFSKLSYSTSQSRPTYKILFDIANEKFPNSMVLVLNSDVYFDDTLSHLASESWERKFFCITRKYFDPGLSIWRLQGDGLGGSYDAWGFQTPVEIPDCDSVVVGINGCDSLISGLAHRSGLDCVNPCKTIALYHHHFAGDPTRQDRLDGGNCYWGDKRLHIVTPPQD